MWFGFLEGSSMTMTTGRHRAAVLLLGLLCASAAAALSEEQIAQLVCVDQAELPRLLVDSAQFLPDGHVVLGGWFDWPASPVVAVIPNDVEAMQLGTQAASPRFALSPDGKSLAFWKRVKVGQQDRAELTIVRLDNQLVTTLGEPIAPSESMYLAWLVPSGPLVYATEDPAKGSGVLFALDLVGGKPRKVFERSGGQWRDLRPGNAEGTAAAQWSSGTPEAYTVNCLPDQAALATPAPTALPAPGEARRTLEIDGQGQLVLGLSETEGVVVDREVRCARWRPDGGAILYVKDKDVYVVGPTGAQPRLLMTVPGGEPPIFLRGCAWSGDGNSVAAWGAAGNSGRAFRATLGQEQVTARFTFPREAPVKAESRLWVVSRFMRDALGNIVEPVWSTLKGQFVVTRILRTPEGIIAEARNQGGQAGAVERLSAGAAPAAAPPGHISIAVSGQQPTTWSRTTTLNFRPGLVGWLEKTRYTGEPGVLTVQRQMLGATNE